MSDINAIEAIAPAELDTTALPNASIPPPAMPTGQPQAASGTADEPAVVVSLSNEAAASLQAGPTALSLEPAEVDYALSWASGVNGFAANAARGNAAGVAARAARWNKADVAAEYGTAIADRSTAEIDGAPVGSPSEALYYAANLGIPILDSVSPDTAKNGALPGTIRVGAFTFTHGGATYAVTPGASGTIIGTKDGRAWKTWQVAIPANASSSGTGAAAAFQTLTSLTEQHRASADEPPAGVDVSA